MKVDSSKYRRRFVVSDIHGCFDTLQKLLEIVNFGTNDCLFVLGDSINTGNKSREVLDWLIEQQLNNNNVYVIRGNHEQTILDIHNEDYSYMHFIRKVANIFDNDKKILPRYFEFLNNLPYYIEIEDFLLVHAGFNFDKDDIFEDKTHMLEFVNKSIDIRKTNGKKVIHGHRPVSRQIIIDAVVQKSDIIPVDNGCVHKYKKVYYAEDIGRLCFFELNSQSVYFHENIDKSI